MITGYANISGWVEAFGNKDSFNITISLGTPDPRMEALHTKTMNAVAYEVTVKLHAHIGIFPIDWEKTYSSSKKENMQGLPTNSLNIKNN